MRVLHITEQVWRSDDNPGDWYLSLYLEIESLFPSLAVYDKVAGPQTPSESPGMGNLELQTCTMVSALMWGPESRTQVSSYKQQGLYPVF